MNKKQKAALLAAAVLAMGSLSACSREKSGFASASSAAPMVSEQEAEEPSYVERAGEESLLPEHQEESAVPLRPERKLLMETIEALCKEPRPLGSTAEYQAAQYLQTRLEEYGYDSQMEPFSYQISKSTLSERYRQARELTEESFLTAALPGEEPDGGSQNVIGRQAGEKEKKGVLILSAHYDTTADSIGVVDNAAGVAVVLEAARILGQEELPFALRIVFFGGEEEILIGSRQYVLGLGPKETGRIVGNISVDTLAYSAREEFVVLTPLALTQEDASSLAEASPVAAALLADPRVSPEFRSQLVGDHMAFSAAGIDSVNFGQSMDAVAGIINSPADTYDHLVPELLPTATQLLVDAVRELARRMMEESAGE